MSTLDRAISAVMDSTSPTAQQSDRARRMVALYGKPAALKLAHGRVNLAKRELDRGAVEYWAIVAQLVQATTEEG